MMVLDELTEELSSWKDRSSGTAEEEVFFLGVENNPVQLPKCPQCSKLLLEGLTCEL